MDRHSPVAVGEGLHWPLGLLPGTAAPCTAALVSRCEWQSLSQLIGAARQPGFPGVISHLTMLRLATAFRVPQVLLRDPQKFAFREINFSVLERRDPGIPLFPLEVPACGPNYPDTALTLRPIYPGESAFRFGGANSTHVLFTSLLPSGSPGL